MAEVKWSEYAMSRLREQVRYIAEQSQSKETAWKWATEVFDEGVIAELDAVSE